MDSQNDQEVFRVKPVFQGVIIQENTNNCILLNEQLKIRPLRSLNYIAG